MKVFITRDTIGYEVMVYNHGKLVNSERHGTLSEAECAAKYLSVRYSAQIENRAH